MSTPPDKLAEYAEYSEIAATIIEDADGFFREAPSVDLSWHLKLSAARDPSKEYLYNKWNAITNTFWDLETVIFRMWWHHNEFVEGKLPETLWFLFSRADVAQFHISARAIYDYFAAVMAITSSRPANIPDTFRKLRDKIERYCVHLDPRVVHLLRGARTFDSLRGIRDAITHENALVLTFPDKENILFQVFVGSRRCVVDKAFMENDNVAYFKRYAASVLGAIYLMADTLALIVYDIAAISRDGGRSRLTHPGLQVIRPWLTEYMEILRGDTSAT